MKHVTYEVYQAAKKEILFGVNHEETTALCECGCEQILKMFTTEENGTFYEIDDEGIVEFWTDKHPSSRYYDSRTESQKAHS